MANTITNQTVKTTKCTVDQMSHGMLLWDTDVKGFGIRCRQSGARYCVLKMRFGRRQRWLTIGRH